MEKTRLERIVLFAKTDYHLRYYGSKLGVLWAFLNPFLRILVYYFTFSYLIFRQNDPTFVLYLFTGIITWGFFSETTNQSIKLFQKQRFILENIKLQKSDFFISMTASTMYAYLINFLMYFIFSILFFDPEYSLKIVFLVPILIGLYLFALGISFFLATLYIYLRDLDHIWSIIIMAGFWTVPVIWDYNLVYENYKFMLYNPITAFLVNIRQITLYNEMPDLKFMILGILTSALIAILGYIFMIRNSRKAVEFL
ncbi:MAG: ABC transporter permease [Bacteroidales bacterium]|nr:ABC transporter permease [Bacteroidales bacterium]MCF8352532.1 ABC transporter permease [Bacteroidales bacterium]MCF8377790.1 ABC transporter permease [Bacteroidales bacterium]